MFCIFGIISICTVCGTIGSRNICLRIFILAFLQLYCIYTHTWIHTLSLQGCCFWSRWYITIARCPAASINFLLDALSSVFEAVFWGNTSQDLVDDQHHQTNEGLVTVCVCWLKGHRAVRPSRAGFPASVAASKGQVAPETRSSSCLGFGWNFSIWKRLRYKTVSEDW